jgi:hypothetical protein
MERASLLKAVSPSFVTLVAVEDGGVDLSFEANVVNRITAFSVSSVEYAVWKYSHDGTDDESEAEAPGVKLIRVLGFDDKEDRVSVSHDSRRVIRLSTFAEEGDESDCPFLPCVRRSDINWRRMRWIFALPISTDVISEAGKSEFELTGGGGVSAGIFFCEGNLFKKLNKMSVRAMVSTDRS